MTAPGGNRLDLLLSEIDRQLGEQRAHADALASRSGLMIGATALLTGLLAPSLESSNGHAKGALWLVGIAACAGILTFSMGRLVPGPSPSKIIGWIATEPSRPLLDAKILAVEANKNALTRTEVIFAIQAFATAMGIVFLVLAILGGES